MPKIDWVDDRSDDDQPRWQPRPRRERAAREIRDRRTRLEQIIAMAALPPVLPEPPARKPLHLIWGPPVSHRRGDAEGDDQEQRQSQHE